MRRDRRNFHLQGKLTDFNINDGKCKVYYISMMLFVKPPIEPLISKKYTKIET